MNPADLLIPLYKQALSQSLSNYQDVPSSKDGGPANPLLIAPPKDYASSTLKVMYFGKETNGWEGAFKDSKGVQHLLGVYDAFVNNGGAAKYRGPFWNAIRRFNTVLSKLVPSLSFTYNNIIKVGKDWSKGTPPESVLRWQENWFQVIREEVRILSPDVIIFFTGPDYDRFIEKAFGPVGLEKIGNRIVRQLARLTSTGLPNATFRTYHPNFLYRNDFSGYLSAVVAEISRLRSDG